MWGLRKSLVEPEPVAVSGPLARVRAGTIDPTSMKGSAMDSLLSNPIGPAVIIVAAIFVLIFFWKALRGALKFAVTFVCVALIGLAVFRLGELGFLGF